MNITIIVNCFNSEKYIAETAISISAQSFADFEVLFVDNKSTDNSYKIFKEYSNFRCKYTSTPYFMSLYDARNFAITQIESPVICFLDADDLWSPFYLQDVWNFHKNNPNIFSCQSSVLSFGKGRSEKEITKRFSRNSLISPDIFSYSSFTALSGLSVKKEFFSNYSFPACKNFIGDLDLVLRLSTLNQLYFLHSPIFYHRIHPSALTSSNLSGWYSELNDWLSSNKIDLPFRLEKKLSNDLKYLSVRISLYKLSLIASLLMILKSGLSYNLKARILIRRLLNNN